MKRNAKLDVVRCGMNYMIVLLHAWAAFQYVDRTTIEYKTWNVICNYVCWLAIPTFFMISGYLLFMNFSLRSYPDKLWRRVKRLAVPYLIWNVTFVVFYLAMARMVPRLATRVSSFGLDTWAGALSKIASFTVPPIDGPLWFLRTLLYLVVLSPLLWLLLRVWRGWLAISLAVVWVVVESILGLRDTMHFIVPGYAITCFLIGGAVMLNGKDIVSHFKSIIWLWVGLAACGVRAAASIFELDLHCGFLEFLAVLEAPALLALVAHLPTERIVSNRVFGFFKDMSFFAYAGHFLFCSIYLHLIAPKLVFMSTGKMTLLVAIFIGFGVPTIAAVYWIGRRLLSRALGVYDGTL